MKNKIRIWGAAGLLVIVALLVLGFRSRTREPKYLTAVVDKGNVVDVVGATGALQAVTTVQVGSQVSGTIASLQADFNTRVQKDEVIARLDPSLFQARVEQARANVVAARANVDKARATVEDTRQKYERAKDLAGQSLLPQSDLETARSNHEGAVASVKAAEAAASQAAAGLNQAQVDLGHTVIKAPIAGIVIARSVDVGQTVAASLQAPVLFVIANDLAKMQVSASIDEADVGRLRQGQDVTFRVDAFPEREFAGRVEQVRLQPTTVQNVVTYNTIIAVDNADGRLMPGMTATVSVIVRRADDVLRIPAASLRFRPDGAEPAGRRGGPGGGQGGGQGRGQRAEGRGGQGGGRGDGGGQRGEGRAGEGGGRGDGGAGQGWPGRPATIHVLGADGKPQPVSIRTGISDGQFVEVREGLSEGTRVVTGLDAGTGSPRPGPSASANPFNPQQPQRRQR